MDRQNSDDIMRFLEGMASSDEVLFGFLDDDGNHSPDNYIDSGNSLDDEEEDDVSTSEESKAFWQEQEQLLQATVYRTSALETKIRNATKEAMKEINSVGLKCVCRRPVAGGCRSCLRREVADRLRDAGYDCLIRKSKWRSSHDIPAGEHEYLEIGGVVIEVSLRGEFEMARGCDQYRSLLAGLPCVYVGKRERLRSVVKIMCDAAKKCTRQRKMHLGPWRKPKFMLAKWFGACPPLSSPFFINSPEDDRHHHRSASPPKPFRPSMLHHLRLTTVAVLV